MVARKGSKAEEAFAAELGRRTRDVVLSVYIERNREHRAPGWEELRDFSKDTWVAVALALLKAGWRPPQEG